MKHSEEVIIEILEKAKSSLSTEDIQMYSLVYSDSCSDRVSSSLVSLEKQGKVKKKIINKKIMWELVK